jgi:hypothetical protein
VQRYGSGEFSEVPVNLKVLVLFASSVITADNKSGDLNETLVIGDRIQFAGQTDSSKFYRIEYVDKFSATIDSTFENESGTYKVRKFVRFRYTIIFDGNGLHGYRGRPSGFDPRNFAIVSANFSPKRR